MDRTNSPPQMWFLCMCYVAFILNRVLDSSLSFKQPHLVATGKVADISAITSFQWMEPVYYKLDSSEFSFPQSNEAMGYFVGFLLTQLGTNLHSKFISLLLIKLLTDLLSNLLYCPILGISELPLKLIWEIILIPNLKGRVN